MTKKLSATFMIMLTILMSTFSLISVLLSGKISLPGDKPISITALNVDTTQTTSKSDRYIPVPSDTFFVLAVGNDYRPGVGGKRADAIHLIGINTKENKASIINFPRDTNVQIPGHGKNKINAANAYGGSALTAQTIEGLVGIKISYVLEVDFAGFKGVVNDLGGLDVTVDKPMRDNNSGSNFTPGLVHMNGDQALSFARDRHSFSNGDITRTHNQAVLLIAALKEMLATKSGVTNKFESASFITKNVSLTNLTLRDIYLLMELAKSINPAEVSNITVPWAGTNTLAASANDLFADFRDNAIINTYQG